LGQRGGHPIGIVEKVRVEKVRMKHATHKENLDKEGGLDSIFLLFPIISPANVGKSKQANLDFDIHNPFIESVFAVTF
jgi:hypothetical protein